MLKGLLDKAKEVTESVKSVIDEIQKDFNFSPNPEQSQSKLWRLTLAAPVANSAWHYIDSLSTGAQVEDIQQGLREMWGIDSTASAVQQINWLQQFGHRELYPLVLSITFGVKESDWQRHITEYIDNQHPIASPEDKHALFERACSMCKNYQQANFYLKTNDKITGIELTRGILAWDAARVVIVSRLCFDAGYISEAEAWAFMDSVVEPIRQTYSDWSGYWKGFILGRTIWGGVGASYEEMSEEGDKFLEKKDSPFKTIPWNV